MREQAAGIVAGVVCEAEVVLRQDDGTFARAGEGPESRGSGWRADALARQAADLGRPEQAGRPTAVPARGATHCRRALGRVSRAHGATAPVVPGRGGRARRVARGSDRRRPRSRAGAASAGNRSATDAVTGLYSRWYFYERLYAEVARARRYRQPLSLVVGELDGEEDLARSRGPAFRDAALAAMARLLLTSLRDKVDVACRLGGGKFALLLPNTPPGPESAGLVADRVRQRVAATRLPTTIWVSSVASR